jgi:hypothetical protein
LGTGQRELAIQPTPDTAAVDQIVRRCGKLDTTLTLSGREMIVWTNPDLAYFP